MQDPHNRPAVEAWVKSFPVSCKSDDDTSVLYHNHPMKERRKKRHQKKKKQNKANLSRPF